MEICDKCGKILGEAESFENHWKGIYDNNGIPICEDCSEEFED